MTAGGMTKGSKTGMKSLLLWTLNFLCLTSVCGSPPDRERRCFPVGVVHDLEQKRDTRGGGYVVFRKSCELPDTGSPARLQVFADSRYLLWINGRYVLRGPCRFNPKRPEYDVVDVLHI